MSSYLFTSESVSEGHPDKIADQISDAVLDAILAQDKRARVACETLVKTGAAIVAGEVTTTAWVDIEALARKVINDIGYDNSDVGFDGHTCAIINMLGKQSPDINQGVDRKKPEEQGAGDQGLMFGYACNEAPEFMPAPLYYSHRLVEQQAKVRKKGKLKWLRPDAKSQVTLRYDGNTVLGLDAVVLSTQHDPDIKQKDLIEAVRAEILVPVLPKKWLDALPKNKVHINPTGKFVIGGPVGDCGLTGRKIIVDSYGGMARHGGGAFLGQGSVEGGPFGRLRRALRGQEHRGRRPGRQVRSAGLLRDRRGRTDLDLGDHVRHRQGGRRRDREADPQALRPAPVRHHQDAGPGTPDLPADRQLRPLRPQAEGDQLRGWRRQEADRDRLLLGEDRPRRGPAQGRQAEIIAANSATTGTGRTSGPFSFGIRHCARDAGIG